MQVLGSVQSCVSDKIAQCHSEGIKINLQLHDLPPAAAAIVQKFNRDSASMCPDGEFPLALLIIL